VLLKLSVFGMALQTLALALLTLAGTIEYWQILLLNGLNGALVAIHNPTRSAIVPDLVPREHLANAISLFSTVWTGSALVGPAVAGLLLGPIGPGWIFVLNTLSYLAVLWAAYTLKDLPPQELNAQGSFFGGVKEGISFALRDSLIFRLLLLMAAMAFFGRTHLGLMPAVARDLLETGPIGFGLLLAAPGAGALIGGLGLASLKKVDRLNRVAFAGLAGAGIWLLLFSVSQWLALSLLLALLAGVCMTVGSAAMQTTLQLRTPGQYRGRILGLSAMAILGMTNLSPLGGSLIATIADLRTGLAFMAAMLIVAVVLIFRGMRWESGEAPTTAEPSRAAA
jgi:MFS family permease